ncbi:MAG TPA: winged helix-turn-helix domain-containing protein [Acidobacteriota bacterium]|nr:winged helix-turn-helix domain-containing protein [Acidobacteriota bacterium]
MGNSSQRIWRFDEFRFREATGELLHRGEPADLRPQAAKLLELLLADAGQVVTREEIQQHLWPDTVVDFEQGLNTAVRQLRRALQEEATSPSYVQTVPRRGYRWIGQAECIRDGKGNDQERSVDGVRSRSPLAWAAAAVVLVVCGLAAAFWVELEGPVWGDQNRERRLLVLPIQRLGWNECPSAATEGLPGPREYLADALTEELISQAAALSTSGIKILGRDSTRRFGKAAQEAKALGLDAGVPKEGVGEEWISPRFSQLQEKLRADYWLKGTLRCSQGQVRVSLRLVDGRDGSVLWGESYDRPLGGLSSIHRRSVDAIGRALGVGASTDVAASVLDEDSPSEAVLKAEYLMRKRGVSTQERRRNIHLAHELLEQALEENPGDARVHLRLSGVYLLMEPENMLDYVPRAREHLKKAIRLRPEMAEAHAAMASIDTFLLWDLDSAQESFQKALQLSPQHVDIHYSYAWYWLFQQHWQKAVQHLETALDIDPISSAVRGDLGWFYFYMKRYREAIRESNRTLELEPNSVFSYMCLLWSYRLLDQPQEAAQAAIRIAELLGEPPEFAERLKDMPAERAVHQYFKGRDQYLMARQETQPVNPTTFAFLRAGLRDSEGALQALEDAFKQHRHYPPLLEFDPRFEFLHGDPRFQDLIQRIRRSIIFPQPAIENPNERTGASASWQPLAAKRVRGR